jgi:hypothetical protein
MNDTDDQIGKDLSVSKENKNIFFDFESKFSKYRAFNTFFQFLQACLLFWGFFDSSA